MGRKNWGKRSMKEYLGNHFTAEDKFVTYEEMTQQYNATAQVKVKRNTICHWYHKALLKLATNMIEQLEVDYTPEEIKRISRSLEFQLMLKDMIEERDIKGDDENENN